MCIGWIYTGNSDYPNNMQRNLYQNLQRRNKNKGENNGKTIHGINGGITRSDNACICISSR